MFNRLDIPEAARWTDRQGGTLFGIQGDEGRVEDRYLGGNFVRAALLYAAWQSGGTRLDPWTPSATVGAVAQGDCLAVVVSVGQAWHGRLMFDEPRHAHHLRLPLNYPRLNEGPEWFAIEPGTWYQIEDTGTGAISTVNAADLRAGLPLGLAASAEQRLRLCPGSA